VLGCVARDCEKGGGLSTPSLGDLAECQIRASALTLVTHGSSFVPPSDNELAAQVLCRSGAVPPARHIQHPHKTVPTVNCWSLALSMLRGEE
jgi:hypothetical protein